MISQKKKHQRQLFTLHFHNKGLQHIKLASILHDDDVINALPEELTHIEPPSVVYSLGGTIRNKIFNYKSTVNSINTLDTTTYGTGIQTCTCEHSVFRDKHHGHILTGDLRIIENTRLRKLMSKGPNYREARSINWKKCKEKIEEGLEICASKLAGSVKRLVQADLLPWKEMVLQKVDAKIAFLRKKVKPKQTKAILQDPDVSEYLQKLHEKFVLVPIDKAANNVAIVCKRYYVEVMLKEIGILGDVS